MTSTSRFTFRLGVLCSSMVLALAACTSPEAPPPSSGTVAEGAPAMKVQVDWSALRNLVGQYPNQVPMLEAPALRARLEVLFGADYATAMRNLEVAAPLAEQDGVLYVSGNRAHRGGDEAVAIAMEPATDRIRAWLLHDGQARVLAEPGADFQWPADIATMIDNAASIPH